MVFIEKKWLKMIFHCNLSFTLQPKFSQDVLCKVHFNVIHQLRNNR